MLLLEQRSCEIGAELAAADDDDEHLTCLGQCGLDGLAIFVQEIGLDGGDDAIAGFEPHLRCRDTRRAVAADNDADLRLALDGKVRHQLARRGFADHELDDLDVGPLVRQNAEVCSSSASAMRRAPTVVGQIVEMPKSRYMEDRSGS